MNKRFKKPGVAALSAICLVLGSTGAAWAQPDDHGADHGGPGHSAAQHGDSKHRDHKSPPAGHGYKKGDHVPDDWRKPAHYVNYHDHHLRKPPKGYHWVHDSDSDQYLLVAVTTGVIAAVVASHH